MLSAGEQKALFLADAKARPNNRASKSPLICADNNTEGVEERRRPECGEEQRALHFCRSILLTMAFTAAAAGVQWSVLSGRALAAPPPSAATVDTHQPSSTVSEEVRRRRARTSRSGQASGRAEVEHGSWADSAAEHRAEVERLAQELLAASRAAAERRVLPQMAPGSGAEGGPRGLTLVAPPRQAGREGRDVLMEARGPQEVLGVTLAPRERLQLVETSSAMGKGPSVLSLVRVNSAGEESPVHGRPFEAAINAWQEQAREKRRKLAQELLARPEDAKKQAELLAARDEVLLRTWLDKKAGRWEMSPEGLGEAVELRLVESVKVRQDSGAAVVRLKGDSRPFFVALPGADWSAFGGLNGLLRERLPSDGVPVETELMPIPVWEWRFQDLVAYAKWAAAQVRSSRVGSKVIPWYTATLTEVVEEAMLKLVMPYLPKPAKVLVRLEYPSDEGGTRGSTAGRVAANLAWLSEADVRFQKRHEERNFPWLFSFLVRGAVVGYPLLLLVPPVVLGLFRQLGPARLPEGELGWRLRVGNDLWWRHRQAPEKKKKKAGEFEDPVKEAFAKMRRVRKPSIRLEDMIGIDPIREEIDEIITFLRDPRGFTELGAQAPRGVLITGEPGVQRDALPQAIAAEAGVPMVNLRGRALLGDPDIVGEGATNMRELFAAARDTAPVIVFLHDFDTIGGKRGASVMATKRQEREGALNQLLVELDGFETQDGVLLMAVTENLQRVDPALRRPGRVDRILEVPLPNLVERRAILRKAAAETMAPDLYASVDWDYVSDQFPQASPEKLQQVPAILQMAAVELKRADMQELRHVQGWVELYQTVLPFWLRRQGLLQRWEASFFTWLGLTVTAADMVAVMPLIDFVQSGMELYLPPYSWTREFKRPHATWAAGRGVLAALLPSFDSVHGIYLRRDSYDGVGYTTLKKNSSAPHFLTRTYREKQLVLEFGSYIALEMLTPWGERTSLATPDLRRAKQMASRMVMEQGWGLDGSTLIYRNSQQGQALALGSRGAQELEDDVDNLWLLAREKAFSILERNRAALEACIEHLCAHDGMTGKELEELLEATGAHPEPEPFFLIPYRPPTETGRQKDVETPRALAGQPR